jgi:hypothetical protein
LLGVVAVGGWLFWRESFPTTSYRYRLTVNIESDGRLRSGSSVIEVSREYFPEWAVHFSNGFRFRDSLVGQAIVIDVDSKGAIVALLGGSPSDRCAVGASSLVGRALAEPVPPRDATRQGCENGYYSSFEVERQLSQAHGHKVLAPDNMPAFMWFADKSQLSSARYLDPSDFAAVIGNNTKLSSVELEMTDDVPQFNINEKLPVLANLVPPDGHDYKMADGSMMVWREFISVGRK